MESLDEFFRLKNYKKKSLTEKYLIFRIKLENYHFRDCQ